MVTPTFGIDPRFRRTVHALADMEIDHSAPMEDFPADVKIEAREPVAASSSDSEYDPNDANNNAAEEDIIVPTLPAVAGALVTVAVHRGTDGIRCQHSVRFQLL